MEPSLLDLKRRCSEAKERRSIPDRYDDMWPVSDENCSRLESER